MLADRLKPLCLLAAFVLSMASMILLWVSIYVFIAVQVAIIVVANVLFFRWFGTKTFIAAATLITFDLLLAAIVAILFLEEFGLATEIADALISMIAIPAIAYPLIQALFLNKQWSSGVRTGQSSNS